MAPLKYKYFPRHRRMIKEPNVIARYIRIAIMFLSIKLSHANGIAGNSLENREMKELLPSLSISIIFCISG